MYQKWQKPRLKTKLSRVHKILQIIYIVFVFITAFIMYFNVFIKTADENCWFYHSFLSVNKKPLKVKKVMHGKIPCGIGLFLLG